MIDIGCLIEGHFDKLVYFIPRGPSVFVNEILNSIEF